MKRFKSTPAIEPSADDVAFSARLCVQLEETIAVYRRLADRHAQGTDADQIGPEALGWARAGAQIVLAADALMQDPAEPLLATLPQNVSEACIRAMAALDRLCYALCALAEEEVVEEALLRADELDGLIEFYGLDEWIELNHRGVEGAVANGHPPPDPLVSPEILDIPYVEGGMTQLRELLLTRELPDLDALREGPDAPPGGPRPEGFYFASLDLAILILIIRHGSLYLELLNDYEGDGPSTEIDAAAIEASVDIAAVQQSIWRRLDMLGTARHTPLDPGPAMGLLDDLVFSLLLLTGRDPERALVRLDAELFEARLRAATLLDWVEAAGYDRALPAEGVAALREAREQGAGEDAFGALTLSTIDRARIAAPDR